VGFFLRACLRRFCGLSVFCWIV